MKSDIQPENSIKAITCKIFGVGNAGTGNIARCSSGTGLVEGSFEYYSPQEYAQKT